MIHANQLENALTFDQYISLTEEIINNPERPEIYRDEKMLQYTRENLARMLHVRDNITIESKLYNELQQLDEPQTWVCITEPWCGDASQIVPVLYLISQCADIIDFKILLRDSNTEVMDQYLTNGGRSIPKLIIMKTQGLEEIATWGPRPAILQEKVVAMKDDASLSFGQKVKLIHAWYGENKTIAIQEEFIDLLKAKRA